MASIIAHLEMASKNCIDVSVIFSTPVTSQFLFSLQYLALHLRVFQQSSMEEDNRASDDYSIDSESHFTEERERHSRHAYARRLRASRGPKLAWKQLNRSKFLRNCNVSWWTKVLLSLTLFALLSVNSDLRTVSSFTELIQSQASGSCSSISSFHVYVQPRQ